MSINHEAKRTARSQWVAQMRGAANISKSWGGSTMSARFSRRVFVSALTAGAALSAFGAPKAGAEDATTVIVGAPLPPQGFVAFSGPFAGQSTSLSPDGERELRLAQKSELRPFQSTDQINFHRSEVSPSHKLPGSEPYQK
jgi:hypothetical protein